MDMPGRKYGADGRYGFNGKERDKDMHSLTAYDYGFRIYNPAIGKFLSVDPLTQKYPELTPYQFAHNNSIKLIDLDGLEGTEPPKPGTAVRDFKHVMNHPSIGPSFGWLYNWLPENKTGDKIVGAMEGVGAAVKGTFDGMRELLIHPGRTMKTAMDMGHVGYPNATQQQYLLQSFNEYLENRNTYGSSYANFFFWSKSTTEAASVVLPSLKAFRSVNEFKLLSYKSNPFNKDIHSFYADGVKVLEGEQPGKILGPDILSDGGVNSYPHSVLKWDYVNWRIYKARTYQNGGIPYKDIDFTLPTYPNGTPRPNHFVPEQHLWLPNPSGGSLMRQKLGTQLTLDLSSGIDYKINHILDPK